MAYQIIWAPQAVQQLENICDFISRDSEFYAKVFAQKVISIVNRIPSFPQSGRIVPEYDNTNLREKIYEGYRIVYRIQSECIEVVAICHGAQLLKNIL